MFSRLLSWFRWIFGVVPKSAVGSVLIFRIVHYTLVVLIALILGWFTPQIQQWTQLPVMGHGRLEWVNDYWCGIVFLLGYAIVRVILYLLEILGIEEEGEFSDIERPWREAIAELEAEGLPIDELPLFIINGLTPQQERSVFLEASGIDWQVISPSQNESKSPLRVYAYSEGIFVSCVGVGAVSCQQGKVVPVSAGGTPTSAPPSNIGNRTIVAGEISNIMDSAKAGTGTAKSVGQAPPSIPTGTAPSGTMPSAAMQPPARTGGTLRSIGSALAKATMTPGGMKAAMQSFSGGAAERKGYGKKQVAPIDTVESEVAQRRMDFFCELINESRFPYCPINGLLQVIPISWTTSTDQARKLAPAVRIDLETIHESLHLQFPVTVAFSELDSLPGLKEYMIRVERIQPGIRQSRAGSRFATGAVIDASSMDWLLDRSMNWFRGWTYTAFSADINAKDNLKLFHMLCSIRERRDAMTVLLRESFSQLTEPECRLAGCYFFATGEGATEQGFIRGVLDRMVETEGDVAWSPDLAHTISRNKTYSNLLIASSVVMGAVNAFLVYQLLGD
ncbi:hypothetical protein KOR42_46240 [Thalassoglobus neptunius]|uniref:Type VI secretion system component TssM1 N-terminal domain-containing protein n=1 Tax=Thalassoglobus neptunius TaxID=1938619 RepID=A0A5C5VWP7_9PLAN|nr:type VI secretion protein IcmF/TssM N-terminal domain-containing protein [Thalassoglobus neptunius]TWT42820.1 hypothetical protein KOR42_46240 [Thalassoglobus neptunius]